MEPNEMSLNDLVAECLDSAALVALQGLAEVVEMDRAEAQKQAPQIVEG
jgi:hypothetical protein